jgi:hypothetical protein
MIRELDCASTHQSWATAPFIFDSRTKAAIVLVYTADGFAVAYLPPAGLDSLWMGHGYGKILYLTDEWWRDEKSVLDAGREIAKRNAEAKIGA